MSALMALAVGCEEVEVGETRRGPEAARSDEVLARRRDNAIIGRLSTEVCRAAHGSSGWWLKFGPGLILAMDWEGQNDVARQST